MGLHEGWLALGLFNTQLNPTLILMPKQTIRATFKRSGIGAYKLVKLVNAVALHGKKENATYEVGDLCLGNDLAELVDMQVYEITVIAK